MSSVEVTRLKDMIDNSIDMVLEQGRSTAVVITVKPLVTIMDCYYEILEAMVNKDGVKFYDSWGTSPKRVLELHLVGDITLKIVFIGNNVYDPSGDIAMD